MQYDFLKYLNKQELIELESILSGKTDSKDLLNRIKELSTSENNFSSCFIPHYSKELESKCNEILKTLSLNDLFFFATTFSEKGNSKVISNHNIFTKDTILNMEKYDIDGSLLERKVKYPWSFVSLYDRTDASSITFDKIDNMFKDSSYSKGYECAYNMFNYIKNYIYLLLSNNPNITREDVFLDFLERKYLVKMHFASICSYLCAIRNTANLRLCLSNAALSRNAIKTTPNFTLQQETFVEALAFGTTIEKIKNNDYEDYKKLLYLSKERV